MINILNKQTITKFYSVQSSFFHRIGFANPILWKKQTIILSKTGLYAEIGKCHSY